MLAIFTNKELKELFEVIDASSDNSPNKKGGLGMTPKRFTWEYSYYDSTGEIFDWKRNECLMTDYLQKYEIEKWCEELNKIVDENVKLKEANKNLKRKIIELSHNLKNNGGR